MFRLFAVLLLLAFPAGAQEKVVAGLSQKWVSIDANFDGTGILIFGAVKREAPPPDAGPLEVVIAVAGPSHPVTVRKKARKLGIQLIDARIKRADLPKENLAAVFNRMRAERQRISKRYRSEGEEQAAKIRAETDRDVKIILADAYKEAEIIKGRGDGRAASIYAEAYAAHEEFYKFLQSLEVIEKSSTNKDQLIMSTSGGVYQYLK